jgi:poly(A) polymerase
VIKKWLRRRKQSAAQQSNEPQKKGTSEAILGPSEHCIDTSHIDPDAIKVVQKLESAGFEAYFVGGSVRDLMLNRTPKDYDIATNARPEQVKKLFRYSRIIGRRFKLVHIYHRGKDPIEVSTFRAGLENRKSQPQVNEQGVLVNDNVYGTLQEDAWRRDFTINAFYYDPIKNQVLDIVGGLEDLRHGIIRVIGDAQERMIEDPIRVLRALRFAAKLDFKLDDALEKVVACSHDLLAHVPGARLYDAFVQIFFAGYAAAMFNILQTSGYFTLMFQESAKLLSEEAYTPELKLLHHALTATDHRYKIGKSLNPGFLIGVILWPALQSHLRQYINDGAKFFQALHQAIADVVKGHSSSVLVLPTRSIVMIREMWVLQYYLQQRRPKRIEWIAAHRYFRAAFDMLEMRAKCGEEELDAVVDWWRQYQAKAELGKEKMREALVEKKNQKKKRRRSKPASKPTDEQHD